MDEWEELFSEKHKRKYWKNKATGKTSWTDPNKDSAAPAPAPATVATKAEATQPTAQATEEWEELFSEKHNRKYWKNKATGKTSWTAPAASATAAVGETARAGGASSATSPVTIPAETTAAVATAAAAAGGASEWEELFSEKHKRKYWKNKVTGKTSWTAPEQPAAAEDAAKATAATTPAVTAQATVAAEEWEELYSEKHKRKYWKSKATGKTSWTPPPAPAAASEATAVAPSAAAAAADEWEELYNEKHKRKYWKNKTTGKTSWTKPEASAAPVATNNVATEIAPAQAPAANEEWEELYNEKHKRKYWKNKVTGKTSWTPPSASAVASRSSSMALPSASAVPGVDVAKEDASLSLKKEVRKSQIALAGSLRLLLLSAELGEGKKFDKRVWLECTEPSGEVQCRLFSLEDEEAFRSTLGNSNSSRDVDFTAGSVVQESISLQALTKIICNKASGVVELEYNTDSSSTSFRLVFPSPFLAQLCCLVLCKDKRIPSLIKAHTAANPTIIVENHSPFLRLLQQHRDAEAFVNGYLLANSPSIGNTRLKFEASACLTDFAALKESIVMGSKKNLLEGQVLEIEEELKQAFMSFSSSKNINQKSAFVSTKTSDTLTSFSSAHTLPLSGILVMKIAYDDILESATSAWMPCWVRVDQIQRRLVFHEHGPTQPPTFWVSLELATLFLADLTGPEDPLEVMLANAEIFDEELNGVRSLSVSFVFKTCDELWRWVLSFASIAGQLVSRIGELSSSLMLTPPKTSVDEEIIANPLLFLRYLSASSGELFTVVESVLAEREIASELVRRVHVSAATLKTTKFQLLGQRVIVQQSSLETNKEREGELLADALPESAVLLSIHGLSAVQLPGKTILKSIADMPKHMTAEIAYIKFPFAEFVVDVLEVDDVLRRSEIAAQSAMVSSVDANISSSSVISTALAATSSKATKKLDKESTNVLQRMIVRKRSSILATNPQDVLSGVVGVSPSTEQGTDGNALPAAVSAALLTSLKADKEKEQDAKETISMEKFYNTAEKDLRWSRHRLVLAQGKLLFFAPDKDSQTQSTPLYRFQLSEMQLKVVHGKGLSRLSDLSLEIIDSKTHVIVRCSSMRMFQSLFRRLTIALKLFAASPLDLTWITHQAEKWRAFAQERRRKPSRFAVPSSSSSSGILSQMKMFHPTTNEHTMFDSQRLSIDDLRGSVSANPTNKDLIAPTTNSGTSLLQTAEALEQTLSSLELPVTFPNASVVEEHLKELHSLNRANHVMFAELLTMQYEQAFPQQQQENTGITQKTPFFSSYQDNTSADDVGTHNDEYDLDTHSADHDNDDWENISESDDYGTEISPVPLQPIQRRSSAILMSSDGQLAPPPPPPPPPKTAKMGRRASVKLPVPPNEPQSAKNLSNAAPQLLSGNNNNKPLTLTYDEQTALSLIFSTLRENPKDLLSFASKCSTQDLTMFAHLLVHRLFHPWSCDQHSLENFLALLLSSEGEKDNGSNNTNGGFGSGVWEELRNAQTNTSFISLTDFTQHLSACSLSFHEASARPLLVALLYELACRGDVLAFFAELFADVSFEQITAQTTVSEMCVRIIEPMSLRLERAMENNCLPDSLVYTLRLLSRSALASSSSLTARDFFVTCVVVFVKNCIFAANKQREEAGLPSPSEEQIALLAGKVADLLLFSFLHEGAGKKLKLCLSDSAVLSRSKWLLSRCLSAFENLDQVGNRDLQSERLSPLAQLAQLSLSQGKPRVLESFVCLRPSELLFFLQLLDLSNISLSLLATSRQLSDALSTLHASELTQRLLKHALPSPLSNKFRFFQPNALDREITFVVSTTSLSAKEYLDLLHSTTEPNFALSAQRETDANSAESLFFSPVPPPPPPPPPTTTMATTLAIASSAASTTTGNSRESALAVDEDHPAVHELSSAQWLVQAARSMLRRVYEDTALFSKSEMTKKELMELRENIVAKQSLILACLSDWKKLQRSKELLANYKAQIGLLHELLKNRKRAVAEHARMHGITANGGTSHHLHVNAAQRFPVLMSAFRLCNGLGETQPRAMTWISQDEDREAALVRLHLQQVLVEKDLQLGRSSAANTAKMFFSASSWSGSAASSSAKKTLGHSMGSPLRIASLRLNDESSRSGTDLLPGGASMSVSAGGMNPLWAILQNVFSSSSPSMAQNSGPVPISSSGMMSVSSSAKISK